MMDSESLLPLRKSARRSTQSLCYTEDPSLSICDQQVHERVVHSNRIDLKELIPQTEDSLGKLGEEPKIEDESSHSQPAPCQNLRQFIRSIEKFFERAKKEELIEKIRNLNFAEKLWNVYHFADRNYLEANSIQIWSEITKKADPSSTNLLASKDLYKKYLFHFERWEKLSKSHRTQDALDKIMSMDINLLTDPYIMTVPDCPKEQLTDDFYEEVMSQQCALMKNFMPYYGIRDDLFDIQKLAEKYGNYKIDIVHQNPDLYGFIKNKALVTQYKSRMLLKHYYQYQRMASMKSPQYVKDEEGKIQFAVNIDIKNWKDEVKELQKYVPDQLLYCSEYDAMRYHSQEIKGVNLPQLYLKVENVWTGGHEENLRLRAINLNHGPDGCYWFTVHQQYAPKFRKLIIEKHGIDIHKQEGLWFADVEFFLENGIPVQFFVQQPGDIVVLGPGCLHWVRCKGITANSAWNFLGKDKLQFDRAFDRDQINKEIQFKSIIPIRQIAYRLLMNETWTLKPDLKKYLANKISIFMQKEYARSQKFLRIVPEAEFIKENKKNQVYNCSQCNKETFLFYAYVENQDQDANPADGLMCLQCFVFMRKEDPQVGEKAIFFKKLHNFEFNYILKKLKTVASGSLKQKKSVYNLKEQLQKYSKKLSKNLVHDQKVVLHLKTNPDYKSKLATQPILNSQKTIVHNKLSRIQEYENAKPTEDIEFQKSQKKKKKNIPNESDEENGEQEEDEERSLGVQRYSLKKKQKEAKQSPSKSKKPVEQSDHPKVIYEDTYGISEDASIKKRYKKDEKEAEATPINLMDQLLQKNKIDDGLKSKEPCDLLSLCTEKKSEIEKKNSIQQIQGPNYLSFLNQ